MCYSELSVICSNQMFVVSFCGQASVPRMFDMFDLVCDQFIHIIPPSRLISFCGCNRKYFTMFMLLNKYFPEPLWLGGGCAR